MSRYTNHTSRPTRLRMSGATPLLPLYALMALTETFFCTLVLLVTHIKEIYIYLAVKLRNITDLFLSHNTTGGNTEHVGATLMFYNCIWDIRGSNICRHTVTPFIQTEFPWFSLVLLEEWRECVSITTRPLRYFFQFVFRQTSHYRYCVN